VIRVPSSTDIGPALSDLRILHGLNHTDIAEGTGIDRSLIGHYERGRNNPSLPNLLKIVNFYGYDLALVPREQA
jgi:transcriptional regulator with XRE-family HTH domain